MKVKGLTLLKIFVKKIRSWLGLPSSQRDWGNFYHAFELHFRGEGDFLHQRLRDRYGGIVERQFSQLSKLRPSVIPRALDLGCGNGEFLELCQAAGFSSFGVDSSSGAIAT